MPRPVSDFSRWPLVYFNLDGAADATQAQAVIDGLKSALGRGQPFATICDVSQMGGAGKDLQDVYARFMDEQRDAFRRHCKGGAMVVTSAPMRLLINAFVLLARMPFPTRAFA